MVRVPGTSGYSGFHLESQEDVTIKEEYGEEVPTNAGSTEASLNTARSTDQRSLERISAARHENLDSYTTDKDTTKFKSNLSVSTKSAVSTRSTKKKKVKAARTKLKTLDSGSEDAHKPRSTIAKDLIEQAYHRKIRSETLLQDPVLAIIHVRQIGDLTGPISKPNTSTDRLNAVRILLDLLQEAGLVAGEFDPDALFEMELGAIQAATQDLYESLKILVGEHVQTPDLNYQAGSSYYASATSEPDSDSPRAPPEQRPAASSRTPQKLDQAKERQIPGGRTIPTTDSTGASNKLDEHFQMAMNRFLREQNLVTVQPPPLGTQDVDLESVGTPDLDSWEVRISAISDLKEFTGKDMDEDRARAWIGKVKSAFQRDQATEEVKCLTFGDLMVGSAKNWHRQLIAWQYYRARKRSEETPLDYLYRLNVAALRAKLKIQDGNPKARREHVDHYIETLGDPELADRLMLLIG
ncbi:hypothetical protein PHMEG_00032468 [Phytophthora megakarya]|uniref:Eukaryotic/viral aspartic protease n=1 Tax=Phytophthora megakarya TaxID=4795 RepID=A0A225UVI6_9STRA|nr:hypothetical protein PHMEG_00032468 [Phytophthora megakarya]